MGVGNYQVDHALAILAAAQMHAVIALDQFGVLLPAVLEHRPILVPEHGFVAFAGDVVSCRRTGHRLPDLDRRVQWLGDQGQRLHTAPTVVKLARGQLVVLPGERERLLVPG